MKYSQKIIEKSSLVLEKLNTLGMDRWEMETKFSSPIVFFYEVKDDKVSLKHFKTDIEGELRGLIYGLFELIQYRNLADLKRFTPKELDFYLRDDQAVPAIEHYSDDFMEICSIPHKLYKHITTKPVETLISSLTGQKFIDISFSEQVELFEEFLSVFIYNNSNYQQVFFDLEDVDVNDIKIAVEGELPEYLKGQFVEWLSRELELKDVEITLL